METQSTGPDGTAPLKKPSLAVIELFLSEGSQLYTKSTIKVSGCPEGTTGLLNQYCCQGLIEGIVRLISGEYIFFHGKVQTFMMPTTVLYDR